MIVKIGSLITALCFAATMASAQFVEVIFPMDGLILENIAAQAALTEAKAVADKAVADHTKAAEKIGALERDANEIAGFNFWIVSDAASDAMHSDLTKLQAQISKLKEELKPLTNALSAATASLASADDAAETADMALAKVMASEVWENKSLREMIDLIFEVTERAITADLALAAETARADALAEEAEILHVACKINTYMSCANLKALLESRKTDKVALN